MEIKKRVCCLYRVSKAVQVDKTTDDIPLQKQACHEFVEQQGWEIANEFYEKGVSGFKVSSTKRDAIIEIQREAALGNFDILLVFMFDRLGRKEDETPFVVEWFIRHKIEVWSVKEGEQRLDSHVDKLLNYIRYWQASGESIKTSERIKTRIAQIVQEGHYAGGPAPFGYCLKPSGRISTKGNETLDFFVDDETVDMVKTIFNLYVNEGYGSIRLVRYLHERGSVKSSNGKPFSPRNVSQLLQNEMYIGYIRFGDTRTYVPRLKIIDDDTFQRAQEIRQMRRENCAARSVPMTTRGSTLLSGNIFCGHCGRKMRADKYNAKSINKNGELSHYRVPAYACTAGYSRAGSTCQQRYSAMRIDTAVRSVLQRVFEQIRETPPADCWEKQYKRTLSDINSKIKNATRILDKLNKDLKKYNDEVIKVLSGDSDFTAKTLDPLIRNTENKIANQFTELEHFKSELTESDALYKKTKEEHIRIRSWSERFNESSLDAQKMVASSLISAVRIRRGYLMEIDFNISVKEFVESASFAEENLNVAVGD